MSVTLQNMIDRVNDLLSNYVQHFDHTDEGDGSTTTYKIEYAPIVADTESVTVAGVAISEDSSLPVTAGLYNLDDDTGWLVFGTAPTDGDAIVVSGRYKLFSDTMVTTEINNAIEFSFGAFYTVASDQDTVTDGSAVEYPLPPTTESVIRVEWSSNKSSWSLMDRWEMLATNTYQVTADTSDYLSDTTSTTLALASGEGASVSIGDVLKDDDGDELVHVTAKSTDTLTVTRGYRSTTAAAHASAATWVKWNDRYLRFPSAPTSGYLRTVVQKRGASLTNATDTLEYTAGIPGRASEAFCLYACWKLLSIWIPQRVRNDVIMRAEGQYVISPQQLQQAASYYKVLYDMHIGASHQRPTLGRWAL